MGATTWAQALAWRRHRQFLDESGGSAVDVVERLDTVPAAVGDPELTVGTRLDPATPSDVTEAVSDGRLIATFTFGGAVHLGPHAQMAQLLQVRRSSRQWERRSWREHYGLEPDDWPAFREVVRDALAPGPLSMDALATAVGRSDRFGHVEPAFSITLIKALAWHGDLCLNALGRSEVRGLSDDPRWPGLPELDDAARGALVSYLGAFGPATDTQLRYRFGEGLSAGRHLDSWVRNLDEQVVGMTIEGEHAWCLADLADDLLDTAPTDAIDLLPGSDPWVRGTGTADTHVVPAHLRDSATRGRPLVLQGGRVVGTWQLSQRALVVVWNGSGSTPASALRAAAERVLMRRGVDVAIEIASPAR